MQSFIEDPFFEMSRRRVHCVGKKPRAFLFSSLFLRRYLVNVSTVRLIMSHHLILFFIIENKSSEYLQNLVNFEIKTVHLNLQGK